VRVRVCERVGMGVHENEDLRRRERKIVSLSLPHPLGVSGRVVRGCEFGGCRVCVGCVGCV